MIILRCTNDEGLITDLQPQEDIDLRLDISAIENTEIGTSFGISSQEFNIPGDNAANQFFGNLYNLGATPAVALQNSVECQVLTDGQEVFSGKLYIRNIITDQQGYTVYNVVVVNETIDFKYRLQNLALNDPKFDWSAYDHTLIAANVTGSWTGNLKSGSIVYPHVNYGQPDGDTGAPNYAFAGLNSAAALENTIDNIATPLRLFDFKPAIKLKDVIDVIFAGTGESGSIGYQYTSSFFDSEYFNNLYLLSTADDTLGPTNTSPILQSSWAYLSGSTQTTIGTATTPIDFNAESYDNGGNYNLGTNRYVAASSGSYRFTAQLTYTLSNYVQNPNDSVSLRFTKNGSPISGSTVTTFNVYATTGSLLTQQSFDLVFGDSIGLQMFLSTNNVSDLVAHPGLTNTFLQVTGPTTIVGGNVSMRDQFPDDLKALDVIQALIEKFNLVVEPVVNQPNLLRIEPYDTWADNGKVVDWTNKVDRSIKYQISHPALEQPRTIVFSDEEDDDYLNIYTKQTFNKVYGQYIYTADSDLPQGERRIGKVFAATPTTNIPNSTRFIIPHLCTKNIGANETYKPIAFKPRLLYGIGTQSVESNAAGFSGSAALTSSYFLRTEDGTISRQTSWYQMSSLSEMPITGASFDLHFNNNNQGKGAIPPYWSNVVPNGANFITGSGDAFTTYWANYINGLYDVDARKLVCNVYLKPTEIQDIALNDKIFIDGQYYRINKINGANLTKRDTVEVELIRTLARKLTFPRRRVRIGTTGATRDIIWDGYQQGGGGNYVGFNDGEVITDIGALREAGQLDGYRVFESGSGTGSVVWNYADAVVPALQQNIIGTNEVAVDSSKISVLGSKNTVATAVSTAQVMGQYNTVEQNVTNAFIIGQENRIGETSVNTQILGGVGNYSSGSNNNLTIMGGTGSYASNTDFSAIINGYSAALRDSDVTTLITPHENEVVINGSGHTVIGLNLEGAGLDLLNTRNNSNWLGDTYLGEALLVNSYTLNVGDGTNIFLTGSNLGQGKHENLYILNWNGLSPGTASINLPSAANNDYKGIVYTFKLASGNAGEIVRLVPFTGTQTIDGATSYQTTGSYAFVSIHASGSKWHVINSSTGTGGGGSPSTPAFPFTGSAQITGSLSVTGSVRGNVVTLSTTNSTASMDLSRGNAFYLPLTTESVLLTSSNVIPNQHISLFVSGNLTSSLYFNESFFFASGSSSANTLATNAKDLYVFETYTTNPPVLMNSSITRNLVSSSGSPVGGFISASGGTVSISGSYKIHTFTSSGDFTVTTSGPVARYLMVAGGGGGGKANAGGGGAGGFFVTGSDTIFSNVFYANVGTYSVVVGAGGAGATAAPNTGSKGGDSSVFSITTFGGGGGGGINLGSGAVYNGQPGGSGGGGSNDGGTVGTGGAATSGSVAAALGNRGGTPTANNNGPGGGGGGSATTGSANVGNNGGPGGAGTSNDISGTSLFYAGGGGGGSNATGGAGGSSIGGAGGSGTGVGGNGTANRGAGGGGGAGGGANGGNGSAGVVIIKYRYTSAEPS